jgi:hypothetical protein
VRRPPEQLGDSSAASSPKKVAGLQLLDAVVTAVNLDYARYELWLSDGSTLGTPATGKRCFGLNRLFIVDRSR